MALLIWTSGLVAAAAGAGVCLWALVWDRPRGRARCPRCWYDMAGRRAPAVCPECGRHIESAQQLRRTRRRRRMALVAAGFAIFAGWLAPAWATRGWVAVTPAPALDLTIRFWFADDARQRLRLSGWGRASGPWDRALITWAAAGELRAAGAESYPSALWTTRWTLEREGDPHGWIADAMLQAATTRPDSLERTAALESFPASRTAALRRYAARADVTGYEAVLLARQAIRPGQRNYITSEEARLAWMRAALFELRLSHSAQAAVLEHIAQYTEPHLLIIEEWIRRKASSQERLDGVRVLGATALAAQPEAAARVLGRLADHPDAAVAAEAARLLSGR